MAPARRFPPLPLLIVLLLLALAAHADARKVAAGDPAPDFSLPTLADGDSVTLSALKGKVVLVDFWASWCVPCRKLMPRIAELKTRNPELEIVAVSIDTDRDKALTFARAVEPGLRAVHDRGQKVMEAYGVTRMPTSVVLDKRGALRFRHDGYDAKELAAVEREILLLLNE